MQIAEQKKFIFLIGILLIAVILIFVLLSRLWNFEGPTSFLIERPDTPEEYLPRVIEEEQIDEQHKELTNFYDGYRITTPNNYVLLSDDVRNTPDLTLYKLGDLEAIASGLGLSVEGLTPEDLLHAHAPIKIFTHQKDPKLSLIDWVTETYENTIDAPLQQTTIGGVGAYVLSTNLGEEEGGGLWVNYFLENNSGSRVYNLQCIAGGHGGQDTEDIEQEITECESVVQTFELL